jgi:CBS domain-containing protein
MERLARQSRVLVGRNPSIPPTRLAGRLPSVDPVEPESRRSRDGLGGEAGESATMLQKSVAEIMVPTTEYPHIPETMTLFDAMTVIRLKHWDSLSVGGRRVTPRAMLVFNKALEFVGLIRRRDIMRGLLPGFVGHRGPQLREAFGEVEIDPNVAELSWDRSDERMKERSQRPVRDVMIPITTINHDAHLLKAMHQMVKSDTSQLAVLQEGTVVGVVRSVDIINEIELMLGVGEGLPSE